MALADPAVWRDMQSYLCRYHGELCRQWFDELEPMRLDGGILEITARNSTQINYLQQRCRDPFTEAAQNITGALVVVNFIGPNGATTPQGGPTRSTGDLGSDELLLSPDHTFANFVVGPGNQLACAAAKAVSEQLGRAYNPLFIHGGVGLGKTHLLQAICHQINDAHADATTYYVSCDTFMNEFMQCVQNGQMHTFHQRYRHVDLLMIDDIHFLTNRERTQEEFFHTFNTLYQNDKQIVLSSDSPPSEIPQLEERLISRFNWGLVTRVDQPCYETRVAIVQKKAELRGLPLPNDVVYFIAAKIESNTRELEGAITKVQSLAALRQLPIELKLAQQALGDQQTIVVNPQPSIQNIIDAVTNYYGVKLADLQSKRRHRSITIPRQVCMHLARKRTRYSLEEIGGYFGGRDHTTVMHACRTIEGRAQSDVSFAAQLDEIDEQLSLASNN